MKQHRKKTLSNRQCTSFHATGCHFKGPVALRPRLSPGLPIILLSLSSGYFQSALLLAHNQITAPQFIRRSFHSSWYKQVPTYYLLLFAIEAGDLPDSVKLMQRNWFYYTFTLYYTQEKITVLMFQSKKRTADTYTRTVLLLPKSTKHWHYCFLFHDSSPWRQGNTRQLR